MDAVYLANKYGDGISYDGWHDIQRILDWLAKNWNRPDEGIWEVRGGRREFLHSRLMCWVAFDRALRLADKRSLAGPTEKWHEIRDTIYEDIYTNFWSDDLKSFVQYKGCNTLDASVLLMPLMRFISPQTPMALHHERHRESISPKTASSTVTTTYRLSGRWLAWRRRQLHGLFILVH